MALYGFLWLVLSVIKKNAEFLFFTRHPNLFAHNSASKYRSEAILYSKLTSGYPLSPHVKTIAVAFVQAE